MKLITGATGFLGGALIKRLKGRIRVASRNEGNLVKFKEDYPDVELLTGDIADKWFCKRIMAGVDEVYHLAAIKGVDTAERQPYEAVKTNVIGSMNLLRESLEIKPKLFMCISTDKAAQVTGVYGATKFLMERLAKEAELINPQTKYRVVRYGNVLYSTGSVLCKWKERMQQGRGVSITDEKMTRFFWTRDEAIDLVFKCIKEAKDATPYIPEMKSIRMGHLLEAMMIKYGRVPVEVIGNRGGENMHETMDGKTFSNEVDSYSIKEIIKKI